ncbi:MAG TPA: hypothetical protein VKZ96_07925 [Thermomicrobiales bacterium]|nr:hypothetical protein [Thermomicrobiales bacterium]
MRRKVQMALIPVLVLSLLPVASALFPTPAAAGEIYEWTPPGDQYVPRTDGRYIVWLDGRARATGQGRHFEVYGADMTTGEEFPVATEGDVERQYPDVDLGIAIWSEANYGCDDCQGDIVGKNLATGEEFAISATPDWESRPAITNSVVVWVARGEDGIERLMMKDIYSDDEPVELAAAPAGWAIDLPRADDDKVVWSEYRSLSASSADFHLRAYDILTGEYHDVKAGQTHDRYGLRDDYDVDRGIIAWAENHRQVFVYDMETRTSRLLLEGGGCPTIEGDYIFYEDFRYYDEQRRIEVWGYHLPSGAQFRVGGAPGEVHEYANVNNDVITWQVHRGGDTRNDIIATSVKDVLPTAPDQRAGDDSETYRFFDETLHALGGPAGPEFLDFWNASGGLPVFGYPLTSEYTELNPDLGAPLRVQYLERQRFEHHPELAGTPYEVLIGRLGYTAAERAGLLDHEAFQPVESAPDGCLFFSETGHTLCGRFLNYWQSAGLEFGDEGVSYRESLALFGLPLSEEFTDPATGYVSQYFERAIFEYHPENEGTPYEVLLRRLGVEELQARDWCAPDTLGCGTPDTAPTRHTTSIPPRMR